MSFMIQLVNYQNRRCRLRTGPPASRCVFKELSSKEEAVQKQRAASGRWWLDEQLITCERSVTFLNLHLWKVLVMMRSGLTPIGKINKQKTSQQECFRTRAAESVKTRQSGSVWSRDQLEQQTAELLWGSLTLKERWRRILLQRASFLDSPENTSHPQRCRSALIRVTEHRTSLARLGDLQFLSLQPLKDQLESHRSINQPNDQPEESINQ